MMRFFKWKVWLFLLISVTLVQCKGAAGTKPAESIAPVSPDTSEIVAYPSTAYPAIIDDDNGDEDEDADSSPQIDDGSYTATVDYYNPNTNYSATYTLTVDVSDGQVVQIDFPNDGYLDDDHISPAASDENGDANVEGEDGKTYGVYISL